MYAHIAGYRILESLTSVLGMHGWYVNMYRFSCATSALTGLAKLLPSRNELLPTREARTSSMVRIFRNAVSRSATDTCLRSINVRSAFIFLPSTPTDPGTSHKLSPTISVRRISPCRVLDYSNIIPMLAILGTFRHHRPEVICLPYSFGSETNDTCL